MRSSLRPAPRATHPGRTELLLAGAALFAGAELGAGLLLGGFFSWGRAEALLFLAFRPALLLVAAWCVSSWTVRWRLAFYAMALLLAGLTESILLMMLGGTPWLELLRGLAAGFALVLVIDLLLQVGRRLVGGFGASAAAVASAILIFAAGGIRAYDAIAIGSASTVSSTERPPLLLMTGLPLVWGEGGAFDPASRPNAAYQALGREFTVRPLDYLDSEGLADANLMLLAQPHMLAPPELVALDAWVRRGGRLLILADPDLRWPTRLPLGDPRRPPPSSLLAPLLDHWRLRLGDAVGGRLRIESITVGRESRRLVLAAAGRFEADNGSPCRVGPRDFLATCRIGAGRVRLIADADLLRDDLWASPGPRGTERHRRLSDNPLIVADWLDDLGGLARRRAAGRVEWQSPTANRGLALSVTAIPLLVIVISAPLATARRAHRLIHKPRIRNMRRTEKENGPGI